MFAAKSTFLWRALFFAAAFAEAQDLQSYQVSKIVPLTFLDTINRGREISLFDTRTTIKTITPVTGKKPIPFNDPPLTGSAQTTNSSSALKDGFRIQLMASNAIDKARAQKQLLEEQLQCPVYIDYSNSYYKVCIGNFLLRTEAEKALNSLKQKGYNDAWIIKSKVMAME